MATTTTQAKVVIDTENKPENLPSFKEVIERCFAERPRQSTATNIRGVRLTLNKSSGNEVSDIWVKFGSNITMGETKTQRFVTQYLEANDNPVVRAPRVYIAFMWGRYGFIVMEYTDEQICGNDDIALVAAAVQSLIDIPSPTSTPGPVGGGLIEHSFFIDGTSSIRYESVKELQDHINGVRAPFCLARLVPLATWLLPR